MKNVRNWHNYNEILINRGNIFFWFDEESIKNWHETKSNIRGRPQKYGDISIICGLTIKAIFNLSFRATQGFISSLIKILNIQIQAPHYSLLCKRQRNLDIQLPRKNLNKENINIVVDSTGLKIYGEGEWQVKQHGATKHRVWKKLHIAVDAKSREIVAMNLTDAGFQDCQGFDLLMNDIKFPINDVIGDGAYDRFSCYETAEQKQMQLIAPPQHNAVTSQERTANKKKASLEAVSKRDKTIKDVRMLGREEWKIKTGYHKRSLAETTMFRIKTLLDDRLKAKTMANQKTEAAIWCKAINKMSLMGFGY